MPAALALKLNVPTLGFRETVGVEPNPEPVIVNAVDWPAGQGEVMLEIITGGTRVTGT